MYAKTPVAVREAESIMPVMSMWCFPCVLCADCVPSFVFVLSDATPYLSSFSCVLYRRLTCWRVCVPPVHHLSFLSTRRRFLRLCTRCVAMLQR